MEETLEAYMDIKSLPDQVPTIFLLEQTAEEISEKAKVFFVEDKYKKSIIMAL